MSIFKPGKEYPMWGPFCSKMGTEMYIQSVHGKTWKGKIRLATISGKALDWEDAAGVLLETPTGQVAYNAKYNEVAFANADVPLEKGMPAQLHKWLQLKNLANYKSGMAGYKYA